MGKQEISEQLREIEAMNRALRNSRKYREGRIAELRIDIANYVQDIRSIDAAMHSNYLDFYQLSDKLKRQP